MKKTSFSSLTIVAIILLCTVHTSTLWSRIRRRPVQLRRDNRMPVYTFARLMSLMENYQHTRSNYYRQDTQFMQSIQSSHEVESLLNQLLAEKKLFANYLHQFKNYYHGVVPGPVKKIKNLRYYELSILDAIKDVRMILAFLKDNAGPLLALHRTHRTTHLHPNLNSSKILHMLRKES